MDRGRCTKSRQTDTRAWALSVVCLGSFPSRAFRERCFTSRHHHRSRGPPCSQGGPIHLCTSVSVTHLLLGRCAVSSWASPHGERRLGATDESIGDAGRPEKHQCPANPNQCERSNCQCNAPGATAPRQPGREARRTDGGPQASPDARVSRQSGAIRPKYRDLHWGLERECARGRSQSRRCAAAQLGFPRIMPWLATRAGVRSVGTTESRARPVAPRQREGDRVPPATRPLLWHDRDPVWDSPLDGAQKKSFLQDSWQLPIDVEFKRAIVDPFEFNGQRYCVALRGL